LIGTIAVFEFLLTRGRRKSTLESSMNIRVQWDGPGMLESWWEASWTDIGLIKDEGVQ